MLICGLGIDRPGLVFLRDAKCVSAGSSATATVGFDEREGGAERVVDSGGAVGGWGKTAARHRHGCSIDGF